MILLNSLLLLQIEVVLLPVNPASAEARSKAISRAKDAITARVRASSVTSRPSTARKAANKHNTAKFVSKSPLESAATVQCFAIEDNLVNDYKTRVDSVMENHEGNATETIQALGSALRDSLKAHAELNIHVLSQIKGTKALLDAEARTRLRLVSVLAPVFATLAEELCMQAEERFNFRLAPLRLNQEYPERVQKMMGQIVGNLTEDLSQLQSGQ